MEYPKNDKRTDLPLVPFWDIWHILDLWPQFWHLLLLPLFSVTLLHVHCSAAYKEDNTLMVRYADQKHGEISINNICNLRVKHNTSSSRLFWFTLIVWEISKMYEYTKPSSFIIHCHKWDFLLLVTILNYCTVCGEKKAPLIALLSLLYLMNKTELNLNAHFIKKKLCKDYIYVFPLVVQCIFSSKHLFDSLKNVSYISYNFLTIGFSIKH